jgi:hypothetical protein
VWGTLAKVISNKPKCRYFPLANEPIAIVQFRYLQPCCGSSPETIRQANGSSVAPVIYLVTGTLHLSIKKTQQGGPFLQGFFYPTTYKNKEKIITDTLTPERVWSLIFPVVIIYGNGTCPTSLSTTYR